MSVNESTPVLEVQSISCGYADNVVVHDVSLAVAPGELLCLLGPSGCGKTTVLRAIAGFEPVLSGSITLRGTVVSSPGSALPTEQRQVGMVFQDYALFPHKSVYDNVAFGLAGKPAGDIRATVRDMLQVVGLEELGERFPHELSGGQQQRVALARALAPRPSILLMDEAFSNLDVELRERVSREVRDILKDQGITTILVTHDQSEAFALGDRVAVMAEGRVIQVDTPYDIYHRPAHRFVAGFIGQGVLLNATVVAPATVETAIGLIHGKESCDCKIGERVDILLRPDDVVHDDDSPQRARVISKAFKGADILYTLRTEDGTRLLSMFPSHHNHKLDEWVGIRLIADHLVVFPAESG